MWTEQVQVLDDVAPAAWLAPLLGGSFGAVARTVPRVFGAYARLLHPAHDEDDRPVRWSDVAARTGRRVHATAQWDALVRWRGPSAEDGRWPGGEPRIGNLEVDPLVALCDVLGRHTTTPDDCYFCLWEGFGQLHGSPAPRVSLPGREYLLLRGRLSAVEDLARFDGDLPGTQSPQLFWPADRAWCVATEIDFDSTLVGGSAELIADLLRTPSLEAWPIGPEDSVASDADRVNLV
ncbi:hypothetical protein [Pengzhenrongella phosphoraccumulans]|uniref:hypothetical protein n=1 Tax=Pengzhenrongella phosphoraccumulans TaxID=3114394 RepID=UPI00389059C6